MSVCLPLTTLWGTRRWWPDAVHSIMPLGCLVRLLLSIVPSDPHRALLRENDRLLVNTIKWCLDRVSTVSSCVIDLRLLWVTLISISGRFCVIVLVRIVPIRSDPFTFCVFYSRVPPVVRLCVNRSAPVSSALCVWLTFISRVSGMCVMWGIGLSWLGVAR